MPPKKVFHKRQSTGHWAVFVANWLIISDRLQIINMAAAVKEPMNRILSFANEIEENALLSRLVDIKDLLTCNLKCGIIVIVLLFVNNLHRLLL